MVSNLEAFLCAISDDGTHVNDQYMTEETTYTLFLDVADYVNNGVWNTNTDTAALARICIREGSIPQAAIYAQLKHGGEMLLRFDTNEKAQGKLDSIIAEIEGDAYERD